MPLLINNLHNYSPKSSLICGFLFKFAAKNNKSEYNEK